MLKAIQRGNGYINKSGHHVITYAVTGPTLEVAEYLAMESARRNVLPEAIAKFPDGSPILFISLDQELRNGTRPQPSYDLIKNHLGTQYNRDTLSAKMKMFEESDNATIAEVAKIRAQKLMGGSTQQSTPATTRTTTAAPVNPVVTKEDDILDGIEQGAGAGAAETVNAAGEEALTDN